MDKDMSIKNINDFLEDTDVKPLDKAISNSLYGFKHFGTKPILESNTDNQGFTFFTRPQLNLSTINIRNIRSFYSLLDKKRLSANRFVRVTLDPRLPYKLYIRGKEDFLYGDEIIDTPLVDKYNAFIPILSNTLKNISGWPDMVVPTFTSGAGIRKEQISMIDGSYEILDSFDLSATFKNFQNEPLTLLFNTWVKYASLCFEGMMYPYIDTILENEFDYNTRIYRFVMDKSGTIIKKWSATGASFPYTFPSGKFYDFADDKPYSSQTGEININFKCMGAIYNEDILLKEFNQTSAIFNPYVRAFLNKEYDKISIIPDELLPLMNYRGYPVIDLDTRKFIWITNKGNKTLNRMLNNLKAQAEQRRQEAYASEQARKKLNKKLNDTKNELLSNYEKYNKKELEERKAKLKITEPTTPAPIDVKMSEVLYEEATDKPTNKKTIKEPIKKIREEEKTKVEKAVTRTITKPRNRDATGWTQVEISAYYGILSKRMRENNNAIKILTKETLALQRKAVGLVAIINNLPEGDLKNQYMKILDNIEKNINLNTHAIINLKRVRKKIFDTKANIDILKLPKAERTGKLAGAIKEGQQIINGLNSDITDLNNEINNLNNKVSSLNARHAKCLAEGSNCDSITAEIKNTKSQITAKENLLNKKQDELRKMTEKLDNIKAMDTPLPPIYSDASKVPTVNDTVTKSNHEVDPNFNGYPKTTVMVHPHVDPVLTKEEINQIHSEGRLTNKEIDNKIANIKDTVIELKSNYNLTMKDKSNPNSIAGITKNVKNIFDKYENIR